MTNNLLSTIVLMSLLVCGCVEKSGPAPAPPKPVKQAAPTKADTDDSAVSPAQAPAMKTLEAVSLLQEFTVSEDTALQKYGDKTIVVRGEVKDAENLVGDAGRMVKLYGPDREIRGESVQAIFAPGNPSFDQTIGITKGRTVVIQGKFSRYSQYGIDLVDCEIKELGRDSTVTITAEALSAAYQKDTDAAEKEYAGKQVLLEGTIETVEADAIPRAVVLKGTEGGPPVRVQAHADAHKSFRRLRPDR